MKQTSHLVRNATAIALLSAALAVVSPFTVRGVACGHDLVFHMNSWLEVAQQWRQGTVFPRWAANANYGAGEPRFLFYPPLSWILGGALGSIVPWPIVPVAFDVCAILLAGWAMFTMAREWFKPSEAALISVAYLVNPYMLLTLYARSAFGELLAAPVFPLLVLWIVRDRPARNIVIPLALTIACVWLTNVPAAIIATYLAVLLLAMITVLRRNSRIFLFGAGAIALGLALAAFYIVPVLFEKSWITPGQLLSPGVRPFENFLFARTTNVEHDVFLRTVSWAAVGEVLALGFAAWSARRRMLTNSRLYWCLGISGSVAFLLMLPVAGVAYRRMPDLQFLQFPWRWLLVISVSLAVFAVAPVPHFRAKPWLYAFLFAAMIAVCNRAFQPQCDPAETPAMIANLYHAGYGYMGTDEYTPAGADNYEIKPDFPQYLLYRMDGTLALEAHVLHWRARIYRKELIVESPQPVQLMLRLTNYPAWRVMVNGLAATPQSEDPTGRMVIALSSGRSEVDVRFKRTADRWLGDAMSLLAIALITALFLTNRARGARGFEGLRDNPNPRHEARHQ
ncbi:MAG TPA: 6-pyruvoyl-tetrahydropterin synthase-related protein [Terriglobales bacterium]|nr:6-pyruvoyl-tetrahydropterin synthase-related protein [Terriglobales bacterium]